MSDPEENPPENETTSQVRERLNAEQEDAQDDKPEGQTCPIPSCGRVVKSVAHHIRYMANTGERAHAEYKEAHGTAAGPVVQQFSPGAGDALIYMLLGAALQKRPDLIIPEGWIERAGESHQRMLEKTIGPWIGQNSPWVDCACNWGELLGVNFVAAKLNTTPESDHLSAEEITEAEIKYQEEKRAAS